MQALWARAICELQNILKCDIWLSVIQVLRLFSCAITVQYLIYYFMTM